MALRKDEGFVTLYNSETGEAWACPVKAVDHWTANGYRKTDPKKSASGGSSNTKES